MSVAPVQWLPGPGASLAGATRCVADAHASVTRGQAQDIAAIFEALSSPVRVRLIALLRQSPEGAVCACDLVERLGLDEPTVTDHLRALEAAGLVCGDRRGSGTWYSLDVDRLGIVSPVLGEPSAITR